MVFLIVYYLNAYKRIHTHINARVYVCVHTHPSTHLCVLTICFQSLSNKQVKNRAYIYAWSFILSFSLFIAINFIILK